MKVVRYIGSDRPDAPEVVLEMSKDEALLLRRALGNGASGRVQDFRFALQTKLYLLEGELLDEGYHAAATD